MNQYSIICKIVFVISATFAVGLSIGPEHIKSLLRDKANLVRLLAANFILVPLLGLVIVGLFELSTDASTAILLLACAPGGYNTIQFTSKVKEHAAYGALSVFILSILAMFITPFLVDVLGPMEFIAPPPYLFMLMLISLLAIAPLAAGLMIRIKNAAWAQSLGKPVMWISNLSFLAAILLSMSQKKLAAKTLDWHNISALIVLIIGSMIIGYVLGGRQGRRQVLASVTSMRNVAIALLIAIYAYPDLVVGNVILVYLLLVVPANLLFTVLNALLRRRTRNESAR